MGVMVWVIVVMWTDATKITGNVTQKKEKYYHSFAAVVLNQVSNTITHVERNLER